MWTEGLIKIVGDRDDTTGKYVLAAVDIPAGVENNIVNKFCLCCVVSWLKIFNGEWAVLGTLDWFIDSFI